MIWVFCLTMHIMNVDILKISRDDRVNPDFLQKVKILVLALISCIIVSVITILLGLYEKNKNVCSLTF